MSSFSPSPDDLKESFQRVYEKKKFLERECQLLKEAKIFEIDLEKYRSLFEIFSKGQIDDKIIEIPKVNIRRWKSSPKILKSWFDKQSKLKLLWIVMLFLIEKGVIFVALGQYILSVPQRNKEAEIRNKRAQIEAWQVINTSGGKVENGSLIIALETLNKQSVILDKVILNGAYLRGINLQKATIEFAQLQESNFYQACLYEASLRGSYLTKAKLNFSNISNAYLEFTDLSGASLNKVNFQGADLKDALLEGAELCFTDFRGVTNLDPTQIKKAKYWETAIYDQKFYQKLGLSPNNPKNRRDYCEKNFRDKKPKNPALKCPRSSAWSWINWIAPSSD